MAARKESTGTAKGSSGKSNTKKSTATRKTSGTAKKTSAAAGKKTQTKSGTSGRSGAKRGTGSAAQKNGAKGSAGSAVRSEVGILTTLALTVFGTLSVFGLCGSAGAVVRNFLYGVFGILACIVPLLFFVAVMFFVSNLGNGKALGKLVAAILIVPDLCGLIQLVVSPYVRGETLREIYEAGAGGGWLGGAVKQGLCGIFDVVGAYLILVLILLICLVVITEKSLTRWLRAGGERILGRARADYDYQVEQNEENRARSEERKEERRIQREERRRQAEERRRQEEENREEHRRRTDHKVRGVEIRDNTVIGDADPEEDISGTPADASHGREDGAPEGSDPRERAEEEPRGSGNRREAEPEDQRSSRSWDTEPEDRSGSRSWEAEPEDRRSSRSWETEPEDRSGSRSWETEPEDRSGSRSWETEPEDRRSSKSRETEPKSRSDRETGQEAGVYPEPENETEDPTVEWWNPYETGDPVSGEAIDQLERELKGVYEGGSEEPENEETTDPEGRSGEEELPWQEDEFAETDEPAGGVRRLDFMQERVNRRMEEFETVKPNRGKNAGSEAEQQPRSGAETGTGPKSGSGAAAGAKTEPSAEKSTGKTAETGNAAFAGGSQARPAGAAGGGKPAAPEKPPYRKPPTSLLTSGGRTERDSQAELDRVADKLQDTLKRFGVNVTITDVSRGPSVTRYELLPEAGTRVNRITSLSDDIKLALAATDIRIEAPIPGKSAIGIEVPNKRRETVYLKDLVESGELKGHTSKIAFAAGKDIAGKVVVADIAKMPHMLIAGTTGSGKSVFTNSIIMTILFRATPDEVKLIIIDPKVVEFGIYNGIPHLMTPVVTDPRKAAEALKWATAEMSRRYQAFANENVRDLKGYNKKIEREHPTDKDGNPLPKLPQIVIIIDELADLMMVAAKDVEETICRLAQLARAAGIHLIIATQRPSVDVVTGLIKANIPSRVALLVSSGVDSRTIIDMNGAEKLLGNGDMLFAPSGYAKPVRLQGAFVSDEEVRSVVDFLKQQTPEGGAYDTSMFDEVEAAESQEAGEERDEQDELFADAARFLIEKKRASVSLLQRKFRVGFNRAARIIDQLEEAGVVGEELGTKPRNVLMTAEEFESYLKEKE